MRATGWLRRSWVELAWGAFALANLGGMLAWPNQFRLQFYLVWISLTLVYGFRLWRAAATAVVLAVLSTAMIGVFVADGFVGDELWGRVVAVPCLAVMFAATAWHAHRRAAAQHAAERVAEARASLVERERQFLYDASHELRTPITIARGHLELLRWEEPDSPELDVALDELARMEGILERLLLLARAEQPDFLVPGEVDLEVFLEDVFMRWSEVASRPWRLEVDVGGIVHADAEALRSALDALLENAVKYTEPSEAIRLRAWGDGGEIVIEVVDEGRGVPPEAVARIFDRFARADGARTREKGGAGLGLALVAAIAKAHGGTCTVEPRVRGTAFALRLPVRATVGAAPGATPPSDVGVDAALGIAGS
jgi:signal transduction histidine kinase